MKDADIIAASLENPDQFGLLFERHYRHVYRFTTAAIGGGDGPDLADEVFVRAFASRHRYDPEYPDAIPWLLGIASHLVKDYYRSRARKTSAYDRLRRQL